MRRGKIVIYSHRRLLAEMIANIIGYKESDIIICSNLHQLKELCQSIRVDLVITLSASSLLYDRWFTKHLRQADCGPAIYVISWHHTEQMVLSLLECGIDQYMTFPICMGRIKLKTSRRRRHNIES